MSFKTNFLMIGSTLICTNAFADPLQDEIFDRTACQGSLTKEKVLHYFKPGHSESQAIPKRFPSDSQAIPVKLAHRTTQCNRLTGCKDWDYSTFPVLKLNHSSPSSGATSTPLTLPEDWEMKFSTTGDVVMANFYAVGNPSLSTYCYAEYQNSGGSWVITSNALGNFDTQSKSFRMNCYLNHDTEPEKWATFVGWPLNTQKPAIHMGNGRQIVLRGKVTDSCVQLFVPQTNPDNLIPGEGAYVRQVGFYGHW